MEGGDDKRNIGFTTNDNSTSHRPCILIGLKQRKPSESCPKDVKTTKNFVQYQQYDTQDCKRLFLKTSTEAMETGSGALTCGISRTCTTVCIQCCFLDQVEPCIQRYMHRNRGHYLIKREYECSAANELDIDLNKEILAISRRFKILRRLLRSSYEHFLSFSENSRRCPKVDEYI